VIATGDCDQQVRLSIDHLQYKLQFLDHKKRHAALKSSSTLTDQFVQEHITVSSICQCAQTGTVSDSDGEDNELQWSDHTEQLEAEFSVGNEANGLQCVNCSVDMKQLCDDSGHGVGPRLVNLQFELDSQGVDLLSLQPDTSVVDTTLQLLPGNP
jgi:hypothetical protein